MRWTPPFLPAVLSDWLETLHRTVLQCTVVGNIEPAILGQLQAAPYLQIFFRRQSGQVVVMKGATGTPGSIFRYILIHNKDYGMPI